MKTPQMVGGFLVSILLCTPILPAAQLNVGPGETYTTIQSAIDAAAEGDTVVVSEGEYNEAVLVHKNLVLTSVDPNDWKVIKRTVIDGENRGGSVVRVARIFSGEGLICEIRGLTVKGADDFGGLDGGRHDVTVRRCIITDNTGSGLRRLIGKVSECIITGNHDTGLDNCQGIVENCVISDNTGFHGGGLYACDVEIINCTIANNEAVEGGGALGYCSGNIVNSILYGNSEPEFYGGSLSFSHSCFAGASGNGNIDADPGFAFGDDYHILRGSPCIDAGTDAFPEGLAGEDLDGGSRELDGDGDGVGCVDIGAYEFNLETPRISISRNELIFYFGIDHAKIQSADFSIRNAGGGNLEWAISSGCSWVEVSPVGGSSTEEIDDVVVTANVESLGPGRHSCELTITDDDAANSPQILTVTVYVGIQINVPDDFETIQEAIDNSKMADTVVVAPGVYKENVDFKGKLITVRSSDPYDWDVVKSTVIDGDYNRSCVVFQRGEGNDTVLEGFTLTNGTGRNIYYDSGTRIFDGVAGGGIYCRYSSPTIRRCNITGNGYMNAQRYDVSVWFGGGIAIIGSSNAVIEDCFIVDNASQRHGAGVIILGSGSESACKILNCTVANNEIGYWDSYLDFQWYDVDCWATETTVENTIIWSPYNRSLHISDPGLVSHCCLQSAYLFEGNYWYGSLPIDMTGPNGNIYGDPGFVKYYERWFDEGEVGDYHLRLDSICIDRGDPGFDGADKRDVDGQVRVMGRAIDIGADEVVPTITLVKPSGGEVWAAGSRHVIEWDNSLWKRLYICNAGFEESILTYQGTSGTWFTYQDGAVPGWANGDDALGRSGAAVYPIHFSYWPDRGGRITGIDHGRGLYQELGDSYLPETRYILSVDIGARANYSEFPISQWLVGLTVDDRETIVVQTDNTVDGMPVEGGWIRVDVAYTTGAAGVDPLVGRRIGVLLEGTPFACFDNVEIDVYELDPETVDISYSADGGDNWAVVEGGVADRGSYSWQLPEEVDSSDCFLKIVLTDEPDAIEYVGFDSPFTIRAGQPGDPVASRWPTLGGNFRRSGLSSDTGLEIGCVKWQFPVDAPVYCSIAVGAGDKVHIGSADGKIYTVDADGQLVWTFDTGSEVMSSPSVGGDGTVYVGCRNGRLYAIDKDGGLRWVHDAGGMVYSTPAVDETGRLFFGSSDGNIYALGADGSELWSFEVPGPGAIGNSVLVPPSVGADGSIYAGGLYDSKLYCLDAANGDVKWSHDFEYTVGVPGSPDYEVVKGCFFASAVVGDGGTIYVSLVYDSNLYAVDPNDGSVEWSVDMWDAVASTINPAYSDEYKGRFCWSEPVVAADGTIYVSLDDPYVRAVNPDGSVKWVSRIGMVGGFTLSVDQSGMIYAACDDGSLYVIDAAGREVGRFDGSGWMSYPVIGGDGTVYVSDADSMVWAISRDACAGAGVDLHRIADINGDRIVNLADFARFVSDWPRCSLQGGAQTCDYQGEDYYIKGDINRDLFVDIVDLTIVAQLWLDED